MDQELWNKILAFDFDNPPSEYGFSIRLANENYWTKKFTEQAMLEYKKFMYLAATSDFMVSPSEIVDTVWHQHLIFTQSYQDFCNLTGKQIQHVPSTHNKTEFEKFKLAKERTTKLYERDFGKQPENIWHYNGMFESLNLEKATVKLRSFILFGILAFVCLTVPAYYLLRPVYSQIDNPYFILGFIAMGVLIFALLELFNKTKHDEIVSQFSKSSFIFELSAFELIYLRGHKLEDAINGTVNELLNKGAIYIRADNSIELANSDAAETQEQHQVIAVLTDLGPLTYPNLLRNLVTKPIFGNMGNSMNAFIKFFNKSKKFASLFYTNFTVLALLLLLSFTRIVTGILRDKPIAIVLITTIILTIVIILFLQRLTKQVGTNTIPNLYKLHILPNKQVENEWQWSYFLFGPAVLTTSFVPLVNNIGKNNSSSTTCGTSCGSSCGSSCSSCGGCGGD